MTLYYVNTGSGPNSHDGDSLRTAFNKINANFNQINSGTLGAVLIQSPAAPRGYGPGALWYDTESGRTYVYYNSSWVDASPNNQSNQSNKISVGLYDPDYEQFFNTVTNVSKINFDALADFNVTDQGNGSVLVGMNSTFKYINIAGQTGLTAQGVDTLNLVAGDNIGIVLSNQGQKNNQTITFNSLGGGNATFPPAITPGFLFNDGQDPNTIDWRLPTLSQLENGDYTVSVTVDGSFVLPDGSEQFTAYKVPAIDGTAVVHYTLFKSASGSDIQYNTGFGYNPGSGEISKPRRILFNDNTVQTTAWLGFTSTLYSSLSGSRRASLSLSTTTLKLSTGSVTFPDLTVQNTAYTGTVDWSNITNIPVVTTSSLNNNGFTVQLTTSGTLILPGELYTTYSNNNLFSIYSDQTGGVLSSLTTTSQVTIKTTSTNNTYKWIFNNDGSVTFPDNSVQTTAGKNIFHVIFSNTKYLSVFSNGVVRYPDGTDQLTAYTGTSVSLQNGAFSLRPVAVPTNVDYGSPSDQVGDIAFDNNYLYYCSAPYGSKKYNASTVNSGTNINFIRIPQSSTNFYQPMTGWTFQQANSSTVYTLTTPASSAKFGNTDPVWILTSSTALLTYNTGTVFTVTNTTIQQSNWIKTAVTNVGVVSRLSNLVNQDIPVTNNVLRVQWQLVQRETSPGVFENNNQLGISAVSGKILNVKWSLIGNYAKSLSLDSGVWQELTANLESVGPLSKTAGDTVTVTVSSDTFVYRITAMTGIGLQNNVISIEQLL